VKFSEKEKEMIEANDFCRLATVSANGWPHCVPVGYVYVGGAFYLPALRSSKKVLNLRRSKKSTILIDEEKSESGVMIECESRLLEGVEAERLRRFMRDSKGWQNDETTVVIRLEPIRKAGWFLK